MTENFQANKRIAKNTILLYFRMLVLLGVSLYTSRIILAALGVKDYGIYNVIGGFVLMFSLVSGSLSNSISRFITFEIGKKDIKKLKIVFSTSVNIQFIMAIIVFVGIQIIGLWFLEYHLNIPENRKDAALWVLECTALAFAFNLISIPFNATLIAHERMSAFAYISILEAVLKLVIVYFLMLSPFDRLKSYSVLFLSVAIIVRIVYGAYCKHHFEECHYHPIFDKNIFVEMTKFAGWNFFGNGVYLINSQGVNILTNIYFGVVVNAARAISSQVENAVGQFINSFTMAINPQITKSYAADNLEYTQTLVCRGTKFSSFLLMYFLIPIVLEVKEILFLWLGNVPEHTELFVQLVMFCSMVNVAFGSSSYTAILATGNIKGYQLVVSFVGTLVFLLTWVVFKLGHGPEYAYINYILVYLIIVAIRTYYLKKLIQMKVSTFLKKALGPVFVILTLSFTVLKSMSLTMEEGLGRFILICLSSVFITTGLIYTLGLTRGEKELVVGFVFKIKKKLSRK